MFDLFGNTDVANKIIKDKMMKTFQLNTKLPCSKKNLSTRYKILFKIERYILSQFNFVVARFSVSKALLLGRRQEASSQSSAAHFTSWWIEDFYTRSTSFPAQLGVNVASGVRGGKSVVHRHVGKNRKFSKIALNKEAASYIVDTFI